MRIGSIYILPSDWEAAREADRSEYLAAAAERQVRLVTDLAGARNGLVVAAEDEDPRRLDVSDY